MFSECTEAINYANWSAAFLHLQRFLQPLLQPQEISSWHDFGACGNVVQWRSYITSVFTQPQLVGDGNTWSGSSVFS